MEVIVQVYLADGTILFENHITTDDVKAAVEVIRAVSERIAVGATVDDLGL